VINASFLAHEHSADLHDCVFFRAHLAMVPFPSSNLQLGERLVGELSPSSPWPYPRYKSRRADAKEITHHSDSFPDSYSH
jgi:hypothetical protein